MKKSLRIHIIRQALMRALEREDNVTAARLRRRLRRLEKR